MLTVFSRLTAILSYGIRVANFSLDQVQLKKYIHLSALPSGHWDERDFVSWLQFLEIIAIESAWLEFRKTPYIQRAVRSRKLVLHARECIPVSTRTCVQSVER